MNHPKGDESTGVGRAGSHPDGTSPRAPMRREPGPSSPPRSSGPAAGRFFVSGTEPPESRHHRRPPCCVGWPGGQGGSPVRVHRVRLRRRALVRQVPGLLLVRDARGGGRRPAGQGESGREAAPAARRRQRGGGAADPDRSAGARPCARRRSRPGVARPRRRRAGRRQVDAAADGARCDLRRPARAARHGRGVGGPGEAAGGAPRRGGAGSRSSRRRSSTSSARRSRRSGPTSA